MEIVKAFTENNLHTEIIIKGTNEFPLFRASDIAEILEMTNIRVVMQDFDETEKITIDCQTKSGIKGINYLTEQGLYQILFRSNKPIAKIFKKWICEVIKEIRLNGKYELQKIINKKDEELILKDESIKEKDEENKRLIEEQNKIKLLDKTPVIYIYNIDTRMEKPELKIGSSQNFYERIKPYKQTNKFGKIEFTVPVYVGDLRKLEDIIHYVFKDYKISGEVFQINVDNAKFLILYIIDQFNLAQITDKDEQLIKLKKIYDHNKSIIENIPNPKTSTNTISTQTDFIDDNEENIKLTKPLIFEDNLLIIKFNNYVEECCIVRSDVEDSTVNLAGQYRIWNKNASKEEYHAFLSYLKTKFKPVRLQIQNKNQVINGFAGLKLKSIEYKKRFLINNDVETFIFNSCYFSPDGKVLVSQLLEEFQNWKKKLNKDLCDLDEKNIKNYLKESTYVLYSTIWTIDGNGCGYYGLSLNSNKLEYKKTSSTGKKVEKRDFQTNELITIYETIAKASETENISPSKMSRSIKNKTVFNDDYYFITSN